MTCNRGRLLNRLTITILYFPGTFTQAGTPVSTKSIEREAKSEEPGGVFYEPC